jgi:hypothetical protein
VLHRAGPIAELLGGGSELPRCPRRTGSTGAIVLAAVSDGAGPSRRGGECPAERVASVPPSPHFNNLRDILAVRMSSYFRSL